MILSLPLPPLLPPPPPPQGKVAQTACMSACKHISTSLLQLLLDPELRQISLGALQQLNADVAQCESDPSSLLLDRSFFIIAPPYLLLHHYVFVTTPPFFILPFFIPPSSFL
ncbi:hypothetical protein INR49_007113, partial [Caranx melampygus]